MKRDLFNDIYAYFRNIIDPTLTDRELLERLEAEKPYFQVTALSRDDFGQAAFGTSDISDEAMEEYALRIERAIMEQFWIELYNIGDEELTKVKCPICDQSDSMNFNDGQYCCAACDHIFTTPQ